MASEPVRVSETVRFGDDFELDLRSYELRRAGNIVKLERIPMELLLLLVEHRGQVVLREQIVARVWRKGIFLDTNNSINAAVHKIRQVLADGPDQARFVQTVTGRGYRFIAPVTGVIPQLAAGDDAEFAAPAQTEGTSRNQVLQIVSGERKVVRDNLSSSFGPTLLKFVPRRLLVFVGVALLMVVTGVGAYIRWLRSGARQQAPGGRLMLVVLPFENLTGDAGQDYFSDGMTEEMTTQLGRLDPQRLGVISRTSAMHYKNSHETLDRIGNELGVQYILEGSVQRDSEQVRITAQLIQVRDKTHLWARQYDRKLSGLLSLQDEIAQEIADEILSALGESRPQSVTAQPPGFPKDYEAYDLYLKGRYFWNKRTPEGLQQASKYFQRAIDKDPTYARAYAGLSDSYALMSGYNLVLQDEIMPKARAAALRALEIDDGLAEAHTSLALVAQNSDWDWETADKEFRRAIELNPNYATAHHWYAEHLALEGRFEEAFREIERARQLDPLSLIIATDHGAILYFSRQYDRAIEQFRAVLDMEPNFPHAHLVVYAYVEKGMFAEALADIENWHRIDNTPWCWSALAYAYGRSGRRAEARRAVAKLERLDRRRPMDPAPVIVAYIGMKNKDKAFTWLEKAYRDHSPALAALKVDPIYDPLRGDPRFQALLHRVGLTAQDRR